MRGYWGDFLTIAVAHLLAAATPGPDFAVVLKQSLGGGWRIGVLTAWGVATAICLHVAYSLMGLGLVLRSAPGALTAVKLAGAAYLAWIGIQALRAKPASKDPTAAGASALLGSRWRAWGTGFLTNALNPKCTLFFVAIFATLVRPGTPLAVRLVYGAWIFLSTGLWFTLVALFFTRDVVRRRFLRYGLWLDRTMGVIFLGFALLLGLSSR
jgi:RhtB (resistance to homoserine/threonine) family protein